MNLDKINNAIMKLFRESITLVSVTVYAIVDLRVGGHEIAAGLLVDKIDPSITIKTSDVPVAAAKGGAVVVRSVNYKILAILPDDNGFTTITLRPA